MPDNKVIKADEHIPALKEQRRKKSNRRLLTYLSIFFILILLVVYFQSPLSHIREITVKGSEFVDGQKIIDASGLNKGTSLWQINKNEAESKVLKIEEISEVSIERNFPSTIRIEVVEFERIAYVEDGDHYIPVLKNGSILEDSTGSLPADAPVLKNFNETNQLEAFTKELSELGSGVLNRISEVHYKNDEEEELYLYMNDGIEVVSNINGFSENMTSYPAIAKEIDPDTPGLLHMKMSVYFESWEEESDEKEETEAGRESSSD